MPALLLLFLKRIPLQDWLYAAMILLLFSFALWGIHHERQIGVEKQRAADARASAAQAALATEKTQHGQDNALAAESLYVRATAAPPAADAPHLIVRNCTRPGTAVPAAGGAAVSVPGADSTVEHPADRDIGPALDTVGSRSDAQVKYLQRILQSCVSIGACKVIP